MKQKTQFFSVKSMSFDVNPALLSFHLEIPLKWYRDEHVEEKTDITNVYIATFQTWAGSGIDLVMALTSSLREASLWPH